MNDPDRPRPYRTSRYDRDEPDRYDDERADYDDQPGRHSYGRDPRDMVQGPGRAMAIVGWSHVGLIAVFLLIAAAAGASDPTLPRREFNAKAILFGTFGLLGMAMFGVIGVAGSSMRQCRRYGLCMTVAVLLIVNILLLSFCAVLTVPFGIWALAVLCDSRVKQAFARASRPQTREVDGGWEGRR